MESTRSVVCYQSEGEGKCTLARDAILRGRRLHTRPKGVITYQSFGLDKKLSNLIGLLNFLRRVDKKDANIYLDSFFCFKNIFIQES